MKWALLQLAVADLAVVVNTDRDLSKGCDHAGMKDEGCEPATAEPGEVGHVRAVVGTFEGAFVEDGAAAEDGEYATAKRAVAVDKQARAARVAQKAGEKAEAGAESGAEAAARAEAAWYSSLDEAVRSLKESPNFQGWGSGDVLSFRQRMTRLGDTAPPNLARNFTSNYRPPAGAKPSCAVVLNSGSLLKREDGRRIDSFDHVYRFNMAPTTSFERHVGSRTTHEVVHFGTKFESLLADPDVAAITFPLSDFDVQQYHLWSRMKENWELAEPSVVDACNELVYGTQSRDNGWCSSGMLAVMLAKGRCSQLTLFGTEVDACFPYHYTDAMPAHCGHGVTLHEAYGPSLVLHNVAGNPEHPMDKEHAIWQQWAAEGALEIAERSTNSVLPAPGAAASFIHAEQDPADARKVYGGGALLVAVAAGISAWLFAQDMVSVTDIVILVLYIGLSLVLDLSIVGMSEAHGGKLEYEKLTVVVFVELVKLTASAGLCLAHGHQGADRLSKEDILSLAVSAVLYSLSNYLLYATLEHIEPMIFAVIRDTNIVFIAILWATVFATPLGFNRWAAIGLIAGASVLVQIPELRRAAVDPMVLMALLLTFTNATATVCNEKALKRSAGADINVQNMVLYAMCSSFTMLVALGLRGPAITQTFFQGWDHWVVWIVVLQSVSGLVVSRFLKHLSAVLKAVVTPIRTLLFLFAAPVFTRGEYSVVGVSAGLIATCGTYLFLREGPLGKKLEHPRKPRPAG